ncbi:hypothetical protein Esti_004964 [Eimeria stiedai]
MAGEGTSGRPTQGGAPGQCGCPLTNEEKQPLLILHVDVENIMVFSFRFAKEAASAETGDLVDVSARQLASHILAETVCGTIDPDSGEWKPALAADDTLTDEEKVDELKQRLQTFGTDLKLRRKLQPARGPIVATHPEAAASALRNGHKSLLRRMMLPPTVCLALGCEAPDTDKVVGSGCTADNAEGAPLNALHENQGSENPEEAGQLPQQLKDGFWRLAPSFLSLLFSLARSRRAFRLVLHTRRPLESPAMRALLYEFNLLCEGKHPAFDGENRTKQIFLNGDHGSPDLRIPKEAVGVMQLPQTGLLGRKANQSCTYEAPPTLLFPERGRCYKGPQEIYAGLMYQEFKESRAICIIYECVDSKQSLRAVAGADETQSSDTLKGSSATKSPDKCSSTLTFGEEAHTTSRFEPHATYPLLVWVDGQDLTHFHVCLSSSGILTLVNGVTYIPTLMPIEVETQRPLAFETGRWKNSEEATKMRTQILPSLQVSANTSGSLDVGAVATKIAPSQWDCLTNPDCLVAALTVCEKHRLRLATAIHMHSEDQVEACKKAALENKEQLLSELPESNLGLPALHDLLNNRTCVEDDAGVSQSSDVAYLTKHVVPVLYPALEETLRDRPENPLVSIAFYLLRNSGGYSRSSTEQAEGAMQP